MLKVEEPESERNGTDNRGARETNRPIVGSAGGAGAGAGRVKQMQESADGAIVLGQNISRAPTLTRVQPKDQRDSSIQRTVL